MTGIDFQYGNPSPYIASVDRIDPQKGYIPENCQMILFGLNALKGTGTLQDMREIAAAFLSKQGGESKI